MARMRLSPFASTEADLLHRQYSGTASTEFLTIRVSDGKDFHVHKYVTERFPVVMRHVQYSTLDEQKLDIGSKQTEEWLIPTMYGREIQVVDTELHEYWSLLNKFFKAELIDDNVTKQYSKTLQEHVEHRIVTIELMKLKDRLSTEFQAQSPNPIQAQSPNPIQYSLHTSDLTCLISQTDFGSILLECNDEQFWIGRIFKVDNLVHVDEEVTMHVLRHLLFHDDSSLQSYKSINDLKELLHRAFYETVEHYREQADLGLQSIEVVVEVDDKELILDIAEDYIYNGFEDDFIQGLNDKQRRELEYKLMTQHFANPIDGLVRYDVSTE